MDNLLFLAVGLVLVTATHGIPDTVSVLAGEDPYAISEPCRQHLQLYEDSTATELWAMQMFDSWTKFPSGLLYGAYMDLGNYDECLSVKDVPSKSGAFGGKYCLMTVFPTPESPEEADNMVKVLKDRQSTLTDTEGVPRSMPSSAAVSLMGAVCLPSTCSPMDFMTYLNVNFSQTLHLLPIPKLSFYTDEISCNDGTYEAFRPINWAGVAFLIIFALLAIFSTAYDLFTEKSALRKETLLAFSWYNNGKKLFSTQRSTQDISCLHGIRFLSMMWVVFNHRYALNSGMPSTNILAFRKEHLENWGYIFLLSATLSVDTFFLLSGVLIAYIFLNSVQREGRFNILVFYLHRYIRLTPALAAVIFIDASLMKYTGSGPLWKLYYTSSCETLWWQNLLYVNNYFLKTCIGQSWYLAADMQLYWLSPLVLIPLWKKPKLGKALLGFFILVGLSICFGICYHYKILTFIKTFLQPGSKAQKNFNSYYYYSTHARFTPWLVGIGIGYVLHEIKKKPPGTFTLSMVQWLTLWCFAAFFMLVTLCGAFPLDQIEHENNLLESTFFNAFHSSVWALGVGLMILACSIGYGGPVNTFLSWSFFLPLSRLTYSIYLIHMAMQYTITVPARTLIFNSDMTSICDAIADIVLCALLAIICCLLFESPFIVLEKVIFGLFGVGRSSNKTQLQQGKMNSSREKQPDLEAAGTEAEANSSENQTEKDGHSQRKSVDVGETFSSTSNLLPH